MDEYFLVFANSDYTLDLSRFLRTESTDGWHFFQGRENIGTMLIAILSAVFFTILLVAGNTMAQAVRERTQEIGVLKALGFTNRRVLILVLAESCLIALIGGMIGLADAIFAHINVPNNSATIRSRIERSSLSEVVLCTE